MTIQQFETQFAGVDQQETYLYATQAGRPIGMACVGMEPEKQSGWISRVFVAPSARRQGVGRALLNAALDLCRARGCAFASLVVDNENEAAQALYKSLGFKPFMQGQRESMQYILPL